MVVGIASVSACVVVYYCSNSFMEFSETSGCAWYTFIPDEYFCNLLETCTEIVNDNCMECVSGKLSFVKT